MNDTITVDTSRLPLLLNEFRPAARLLATLAELELAERAQRHMLEARLPTGKTLDNLDFAALPMVSRAHVTALVSGDGCINSGGNILLFGPSGSGKSHLTSLRHLAMP